MAKIIKQTMAKITRPSRPLLSNTAKDTKANPTPAYLSRNTKKIESNEHNYVQELNTNRKGAQQELAAQNKKGWLPKVPVKPVKFNNK